MGTENYEGQEETITDEQFEALPSDLKRVLIAKDVIKYIKTKKMVANIGTYVDIPVPLYELTNSDVELRDFVKDKECHVCAVGSVFMATVNRRNKLSVGRFKAMNERFAEEASRGITAYLKDIFSEEQLSLIEAAFEGDKFPWTAPIDNEEHLSIARNYRKSITDDSIRMIVIMKNIINNNGTFIPTESDLVVTNGTKL